MFMCVSIYVSFVLFVYYYSPKVLPPSVETNFDAFMKTDVVESLRRDVFLYSLKETEYKRKRDFSRKHDNGSKP